MRKRKFIFKLQNEKVEKYKKYHLSLLRYCSSLEYNTGLPTKDETLITTLKLFKYYHTKVEFCLQFLTDLLYTHPEVHTPFCRYFSKVHTLFCTYFSKVHTLFYTYFSKVHTPFCTYFSKVHTLFCTYFSKVHTPFCTYFSKVSLFVCIPCIPLYESVSATILPSSFCFTETKSKINFSNEKL